MGDTRIEGKQRRRPKRFQGSAIWDTSDGRYSLANKKGKIMRANRRAFTTTAGLDVSAIKRTTQA